MGKGGGSVGSKSDGTAMGLAAARWAEQFAFRDPSTPFFYSESGQLLKLDENHQKQEQEQEQEQQQQKQQEHRQDGVEVAAAAAANDTPASTARVAIASGAHHQALCTADLSSENDLIRLHLAVQELMRGGSGYQRERPHAEHAEHEGKARSDEKGRFAHGGVNALHPSIIAKLSHKFRGGSAAVDVVGAVDVHPPPASISTAAGVERADEDLARAPSSDALDGDGELVKLRLLLTTLVRDLRFRHLIPSHSHP